MAALDKRLPPIRCTAEEREKIDRLVELEGRSYAELAREMSIGEMIAKHDRIMDVRRAHAA